MTHPIGAVFMDPGRPLILVTGATGYIGGRLVPRLLAAGHRVRCLVRNPDRLSGRRWPGVELVKGDVANAASLEAALQGVTQAYYLVHAMGEDSPDFRGRDLRQALTFAEACAKAGVRRVIYLGGLGDSSATAATTWPAGRRWGRPSDPPGSRCWSSGPR